MTTQSSRAMPTGADGAPREVPALQSWREDLARVEAAALRVQALEEEAERRFDAAFARAEAEGAHQRALTSQEFSAWMAARHESDAAWGRWAQVMDARPSA